MTYEKVQKFKRDMYKLQVKKGTNAPFNFTGITGLPGKFHVPEDRLNDFYDAYAQVINFNHKEVAITEVQGKCSPMLGDFDLKFKAPDNHDSVVLQHRYTTDLVDQVVKQYYLALGLYIDTKDVVCYVHERPKPYIKDNNLKDGFHLFFDGVRCEPPLKHAVRNHVIDKCRDLLEDLGCVHSVQEIVDEAVLDRNNWFVLGSGKSEAGAPYVVTRSYNNRLEVQPFEMPLARDARARVIRQFSVQGDVETVKWLPGAKEKLATIQPMKAKKVVAVRATRDVKSTTVQPITDAAFASKKGDPELVVLERVVDGLSVSRADKHDDWANVVWGIFNICYENNYKDDYLTVARGLIHRFSEKFTAKYQEEKVENAIDSIQYRADGIKFGSLIKYLEEDNKTLHKELFSARGSKKNTKKVVIDQRTSDTPTADTTTRTVLSDEDAKKLAYEMMRDNADIPRQVNMEGVSLDNIEKCHNGWNCNLPKNRWINGSEISGRGGGTDLLLGQLGLQLVNVQSDPHNPWPKDGWKVDSEKLRQVLSHVTFNNCVFNIDNSTKTVVSASDNDASDFILPCDFERDGLDIYIEDVDLRQTFLLSLNGQHNAVAKYFHEINKDRFRCLGKKWFEFGSHIWNEDQDGNDIITAELSSSSFLQPFVNILNFYRNDHAASDADSKAKRVQSLLNQLQSGPYKSHVLGECAVTFRTNHRDFRDQVDRAYLTPFSNGVLDLTSLEFRDGLPADNMTKSMMVECVPFDPSAPNEIHCEILRWFEEVQPENSLRSYLQKLTGLLLTPDTNLQKIWVLSGNGRNGKSFFINKVLKPAMGSFYGTGATQLLTQKREKANETNEAIIDLVGKRVVVFNEPANNEVIQAETLKIISGEDEMTVRGNYSKQMRFTPTFKTFIVCNDKPKMSEDSFAVWRRVRVIDWPMKFTEEPDETQPTERQLDPLLDEKVKRWPAYFAGLMVHWLQLYREEGLSEPVCVKEHTKKYEEDHDDWKPFREVFLRKRDGRCKWVELFERFKPWYLANGGSIQETNRKSFSQDVKKYFEKHLGERCKLNRIDSGPPMLSFRGWTLLDADVPSDVHNTS